MDKSKTISIAAIPDVPKTLKDPSHQVMSNDYSKWWKLKVLPLDKTYSFKRADIHWSHFEFTLITPHWWTEIDRSLDHIIEITDIDKECLYEIHQDLCTFKKQNS
ncbi:MAG TPA: hypothetical protein VE912_23555 [Bacteroidales bacterium]|nr:hypothetical protein [Bacteroidales bacterium]